MKRKAIEAIPYITVPKAMTKQKSGYLCAVQTLEITGEPHILLDVYENKKDSLSVPKIRYAATLGDWAVTQEFLSYLDVLVDGPFVEEKKNLALRFRGSENQRLIDMPATLASGKIVLWEDWQAEGKGLKEWKK